MVENIKTVKDLVSELKKWLTIVENLQNDFNYTKAVQSKKIYRLENLSNNIDKVTLTTKDDDHSKLLTYNNECIIKLSKEKETLSSRIEELDAKLKGKENEIAKLETSINKRIEGMKKEMVRRPPKNKINYKCPHCDDKFVSNTNMEKHIEIVHGNQSFKYTKYDATFVSEWRSKKHGGTHIQNTNIRNCHYFNSNKPCPFEKLGCKFNHKISSPCKFGYRCTANMCQFKH